MTVNVTDITSGPYVGNGVATAFSYDFTIKNKNQLTVYQTAPSGVITPLTVDSDYTVTGVGVELGGTVVRTAGPLPLNYEWFIVSNYQPSQETDFESQGAFYPDVHESAFDKLTYLILQLIRKFSLTLRFSDTYSGDASPIIPDPSPRKFLRWDSTGMFLENVEGSDIVDITLINKIAPLGLFVGQTVINVPAIPSSVDLLIGGSMLHQSAGDYTYSPSTGNIVLAVALTSLDIISGLEIRYGDVVSQTIRTGDVNYPSVVAMKSADASTGSSISTDGYRFPEDGGAASYYVYSASEYPSPNEINEIQLDNGNVAVLRVTGDIVLEQWGCSSNPTIDSRPYAQAAFEKAQQYKATGGKRTVTSHGDTYTLSSTYPDALPSHAAGKSVALWIEDAEWCRMDLKDGRFIVDTTVDAMKNLDEILCICQETGDQAFMYMVNSRFDGGQWTDPADEPDYNIRADYNVVKYSYFHRLNLRRAAESNIKMVGFVYEMDMCDARFASGRANYELLVAAVDGDGSIRTGYNLKSCVADYAGLHGFQITGGNGTTYASMDTCTADHIGRDRTATTIVANVATAAAYRLSAVFGFNMKSCGAETSTRFGRFTGARSFTLQNCYSVNMGSNDVDNTLVEANLVYDGLTEDCHIQAFREGAYTNLTNTLQLTIPAGFNNTNITVDNSIARSRTLVINSGTDSSAPFALKGLEDNYERGVRNAGIDDARLIGYPEDARESSEWFDHAIFNPEIEFRFDTSDVVDLSEALVTLTNPTNAGYVGFFVEVTVGRSSGTTAFNPKKYIASAGCAGATKTVTALTAADTIGDAVTMTLVWSGNSLVLASATNFIVCAVKVKAITRAGAAKQTFRWGA